MTLAFELDLGNVKLNCHAFMPNIYIKGPIAKKHFQTHICTQGTDCFTVIAGWQSL